MTNQTPIREYEQAVYVYWLGPNLPTVKIGHTNNTERRLAEFRRETGTPGHKAGFAAIVWLDRRREAVEAGAHHHLRNHRRDGEWFAATPTEALGAIVQTAEALGIRYEIEDRAGLTPEFQRLVAERAYVARREQVLARRAQHRATLAARIEAARVAERQAEFLAWGCDSGCFYDCLSAGAGATVFSHLIKRADQAQIDRINAVAALRVRDPEYPVKIKPDKPGFVLAFNSGKDAATYALELIAQRDQVIAERRAADQRRERAALEQTAKDKEFRILLWGGAIISALIASFIVWINSDAVKHRNAEIEADLKAKHQAAVAACNVSGGHWGPTGGHTRVVNSRIPIEGCIR